MRAAHSTVRPFQEAAYACKGRDPSTDGLLTGNTGSRFASTTFTGFNTGRSHSMMPSHWARSAPYFSGGRSNSVNPRSRLRT